MKSVIGYFQIIGCIFLFCSCGNEKKTIERYINDEGKIVEKVYYPDGTLKKINHYSKEDSLYNGKRIFYYPNGKVRLESIYKNDKAQGVAFSYYPSGEKESLINHYNGSRVGDAVWFYLNGIPKEYCFYDSLGFAKYLCKYDSITGEVKHEEGSFMLNYSIDKGEIDPGEFIMVDVSIVNPPSLKIEAALGNLSPDGDTLITNSATYPSVIKGNCYTFEKTYNKEGFYKFALVLKIKNEITGKDYPKVLRGHDWVVNVWE